jgi:hypothetical protein
MRSFIDFCKRAFSENDGTPSSSRILTAISMLGVLISYLYVSFHTGHLPDAGSATGAAAVGTAPYALNRAADAWKTNKSTETKT